jgi:hypothetical protein
VKNSLESYSRTGIPTQEGMASVLELVRTLDPDLHCRANRVRHGPIAARSGPKAHTGSTAAPRALQPTPSGRGPVRQAGDGLNRGCRLERTRGGRRPRMGFRAAPRRDDGGGEVDLGALQVGVEGAHQFQHARHALLGRDAGAGQKVVNAFAKALKWIVAASPEEIADTVPPAYHFGRCGCR